MSGSDLPALKILDLKDTFENLAMNKTDVGLRFTVFISPNFLLQLKYINNLIHDIHLSNSTLRTIHLDKI